MKHVQLWLHNNYHRIRHWLFVTLAVLLLIFCMVSLLNQNRLIRQVRSLSTQNRLLNQQTKTLGEQNQQISNQNQDYIKCVAELFARYTQNKLPVIITNLDRCDARSGIKPRTDTSESKRQGTVGPALVPSQTGSSSSKNTAVAAGLQSDTSPNPQPTRPSWLLQPVAPVVTLLNKTVTSLTGRSL